MHTGNGAYCYDDCIHQKTPELYCELGLFRDWNDTGVRQKKEEARNKCKARKL